MGKTHAELLHGTPQPLSWWEFAHWEAYFRLIDRERRKAAREREKAERVKQFTGRP